MNLDFRSEQALAGARAFRRAQDRAHTPGQRRYAQPPADAARSNELLTAPALRSAVARGRHAA